MNHDSWQIFLHLTIQIPALIILLYIYLDAVGGKVRLVGSTNPDEGVVEYYATDLNQSWVTVCTDFWRDIEADVFCKSLGYKSGTATVFRRSSL